MQGRITIANTQLLSQYTYYCAALDTLANGQIEKIELLIYNFIQHNIEPDERITTAGTMRTKRQKKWISDEIMFTPKDRGGLGCIRIRDFITSMKVAWIRRYTIDKYDDHWADLLDQLLGVERKNRH